MIYKRLIPGLILLVAIFSTNSEAQQDSKCESNSTSILILNCMEIPVDFFLRLNKTEYRPAGVLINNKRSSRIDPFDPNFPNINTLRYDIQPTVGVLEQIEFIFRINKSELIDANKPIGAKIAIGKKHLIPSTTHIPHHFSTIEKNDSLVIIIHFSDLVSLGQNFENHIRDEVEYKCEGDECEDLATFFQDFLRETDMDIEKINEESIAVNFINYILTHIHPAIHHP
ncbi:MAG: hypothetical protein JJ895_07325 [Balneolaceae bacterium]|nr:hypothetical protein [Balneolaceae bacterium]